MYFKNRAEAGRIIAKKLDKYSRQNVAVVALSPGGVIVGAQIAMQLHGNLAMLLTENIYLPGEHEALAAMSSEGTFSYNNMYSPGEIEEMASEYNQYIEQQRLQTFQHMNRLMGHDGEINRDYLKHHVVVVVSDGLPSGFSLEVANDFLKFIAIKRMIIATPIASIPAVDKMHLTGDEICCLSVIENYIETDHYYTDNTIPPIQDLFKVMKNISVNWKRLDK